MMNPEQITQAGDPLRVLCDEYGQAVWLDYIRRRMLEDGELKKLVDEDGLRGVTSNPAIFEKAIAGSDDYDSAVAELLHKQDLEPGQLFERLEIEDIAKATEVLSPVYKRTGGQDGFVSIEVSPYLAYDTDKTIKEARRLWREVGQPNLMVKVPGTPQGLPAIRQLISEGININITLLFSQKTYEQVAQAYMSGLEALAATGADISHVASVASFFVSRIDTLADKLISKKMETESDPGIKHRLADLQGKIAVANAKSAYQIYLNLCRQERWKKLESKGAKPQRLLWASTSTKNPAYPPTLYVDELIGRDTVNTMPPETLDAFRAAGKVRESLTEDINEAKKVLSDLQDLGVSLDEITTALVRDGVILFADAADKLLSAVAKKRRSLLGTKLNSVTYSLGADLDADVKERLENWRKDGNTRRLWDRDSNLWTGADEAKWLDWLDVAAGVHSNAEEEAKEKSTEGQDPRSSFPFTSSFSGYGVDTMGNAKEVARWVIQSKFKHAVLLGMGGSSLGAEVLQMVFGSGLTGEEAKEKSAEDQDPRSSFSSTPSPEAGSSRRDASAKNPYPTLQVLDSTDPEQIKSVESSIDYSSTLFIVSSKSGTTLEPNLLKDYFFENLKAKVGAEQAGRQFIAITDPGSQLEVAAKHDGFAHIYPGVPGIGGRYSVLSNFGMIPGAVIGVDVEKFLSCAGAMVHSCGPSVPPSDNPGVQLGVILGAAAAKGRDKITIVASELMAPLGSWLEQLFAESTGKVGRGLVPVSNEEVGPVEIYDNDRLFIYIKDGTQTGEQIKGQGAPDQIDALEKAGHPGVRITVFDPYQLGQEFFRFEIATATAGSIMGINPFNQPDVEASKEVARQLTAKYEKEGTLSQETPFFSGNGIHLYADPENQKALQQIVEELQHSESKQSASTHITGHGMREKSTEGRDPMSSLPLIPCPELIDYLRAHFSRIQPHDYVALLAYVQRCEPANDKLQSIRNCIRQSTKAATCLGFGPRFLHSTGQLYKGGPNTGVFLQITCDDSATVPVPDHKYTFGVVKAAQALGDLRVLAERKRRVLRVHLGPNVENGLHVLEQAIAKAIVQ